MDMPYSVIPSRPASNGRVRDSIIAMYLQLCESAGITRQPMLQHCQLSERDIQPLNGWVAQPVVEKLHTYRLQQPVPLFGLQMVHELSTTLYGSGLLSYLCLSCPSLKDLIFCLDRYGCLAANLFSSTLLQQPGMAQWRITLHYSTPLLIQDNTEWLLGSVALLMEKMNPEALREVHFGHPPFLLDGELHPMYQQVFSCPLRFNRPHSALLVEPAALQRKSVTGNSAVFQSLCQQAEQALAELSEEASFIRLATERLRALLRSGQVSRQRLSQQLGLSSRQLHRRLCAGGSSYQQILDGLRAELARQHLDAGGLAPESLATLLGFSCAKSFNRWFQQYFNETPHQYRQRQQASLSAAISPVP